MNTFRYILVYEQPYTAGYMLDWELSGDITDSSPSFHVERSYDLQTWTRIASDVTNTYYLDTSANQSSLLDEVYYRLVYNSETYDATAFPAVNTIREQNILRNVVNKELFAQDHYGGGLYGLLLQKKRSGTRCSACVNPDTGRRETSQCTTCYNTGYTDGYADPVRMNTIVLKKQWKPESVTTMGIDSARALQIRAINMPFVRVDDIWVNEYTDLRYEVRAVSPITSMKNQNVIVGLLLEQLPSDNIIYDLTIEESTVYG